MYLLRSFFLGVVLFTATIATCSCFAAAPPPDLEIAIPMSDGCLLPCNLYFPVKTTTQAADKEPNKHPGKYPGKYPCVLVRHPLGRERLDPSWLELLKEGYMIAVQATRSSCDTTGKLLPYLTDAKDGFDTVEYLAHSEWCSGKVATIGSSATGITSLLMAHTEPPHLTCQYIEMAPPSLYQYAVWPGGQFRKEQVEGWLKVHGRDPSVIQWLRGKIHYDDFWSQFNTIVRSQTIQVPQVHVGGWYDIFLQGTIDAFQAASEHSNPSVRNEHKLIIGPWGHRWRQQTSLGDFAAIEQGALPPNPITMKNWLNAHLKGQKQGVTSVPAVQYFVMGPFDGTPSSGNQWRSATKWPPDFSTVQMYLTKEGTLEQKEPQKEPQKELVEKEQLVTVIFDPSNPVPTVGGRNLFMADGPKDLRTIEKRSDVVTFTTTQLACDVEVTGRISACLFATNIQQERDLCVRLSDVYPDGRSILIAEGVTHASAQKENQNPQPVLVDLWSTSMVFAKGHQIRLTISGSNFPAYDASLVSNPVSEKNENNNTCFQLSTGGDHASYIALPVIKNLEG